MFARGKTVRLGFVWSTSYSGSKISDLPVNERSETGTTTWKREGTEKRKKINALIKVIYIFKSV